MVSATELNTCNLSWRRLTEDIWRKIQSNRNAFDTYKVTDTLGEGGAGKVYLVVNNLGDEFALKHLAPERISTEKLKRFKNEINFCQKNTHHNIVKLLDTGFVITADKKSPFYVMPRYTGTLKDLIGKLKGDDILKAFSQILDGVEAAHLAGVWHRDLKPENILHDQTRNIFAIADFGIAHFEEEELYTAVETKATSRLANFLYSAPEQRMRGRLVDSRADFFALGLILNEMFTENILQGAGHAKIAGSDPAFSYLDEIVDKMTQQDPTKRLRLIEDIKKTLIGNRASFVALQSYNNIKNQVVNSKDIPDFEPISIEGADYGSGTLTLNLSRIPPASWSDNFRNPRGNYSYTMGFEPSSFNIHGGTVSIRLDSENYAQTAVDHAKDTSTWRISPMWYI